MKITQRISQERNAEFIGLGSDLVCSLGVPKKPRTSCVRTHLNQPAPDIDGKVYINDFGQLRYTYKLNFNNTTTNFHNIIHNTREQTVHPAYTRPVSFAAKSLAHD